MASWILDTAYAIGRRHGFHEADASDFAGWVSLRLIRRDYAVLRACKEPLRLRTYLGHVMGNLAKDYRNRLWGKWRPTSAAQRLGLFGIELEKLRLRDGFSESEAIDYLCQNRALAPAPNELEEMAAKIPMKPRRSHVEFDANVLGQQWAVPEDPAVFDSFRARRRIRHGLARALATLDDSDRELVAMIFEDGRSIASIARDLHQDQRSLYSRRDRCLRRLRDSLREEGTTWTEVAVALDIDSSVEPRSAV